MVVVERKMLIFSTAALAGLGVLMVYSSSITPRPSFVDRYYLMRQVIFLGIGTAAAVAAARLPLRLVRLSAMPLFAVVAALLVLVLVPGIGTEINGARRWFRLGPVGLQPSELAKLALVLFMARWAELKGERLGAGWAGWLPMLAAAGLVAGLVLAEPDFGTAMFLLAVGCLMLFLAGVPLRYLALTGLAMVPLVVAVVWARPYRLARIQQFIGSWRDPASAPYQVQQSLLAIGSGGVWGTGLGSGWQKLGFLPEANTDFIFAVIGEELGLVGTLTVLALWGTFLVCGLRLASRCVPDVFAYLATSGLVVAMVFQAVVNVAVVTASLPPKGISLPLISYGGSNLVVSLISVGLVLGMSAQVGSGTAEDGADRMTEASDEAAVWTRGG